jgi:hypothetical protein
VILEHSVLGLHTCLVPVFLPSSLLLCITCLVPALQYTPLHLLSAFIHLVCILSTLIPASLCCTCFVIARQISPFVVDIQGKTHHRPLGTLRPTNRNTPGLTDNRNNQTNGWKQPYTLLPIRNNRTGPLIYQLHNLHTITGQLIPQGSPRSSYLWDLIHMLIGFMLHLQYQGSCYTSNN